MKAALCSVFAAAFVISCGSGPSGIPLPDSSQISARGVDERVSAYVNSARASWGRKPLVRDTRLDTLATEWAKDSAARSRGTAPALRHRGLQGRFERASRAPDATAIGENIYCDPSGGDPARVVVESWAASSIHRRNLQDAWTHTGIAAITDGEGRVWVTQIYAKLP